MSSPQIERKLAAIMFTDIAGYTALSAKDSTKASELLKTQRNTLKPIVEKHGGSWMKEMGDGLLLTFDSATSAVECAIAIQEATKDIEDLNLRIGIHEGEVIKQDGDVIGDDVNVASRIEPFSAVGGVAISDKIYRAISSNKEFETKYIGKPKLKGVSQEVKVYCITSHGLPKTNISKVSAKLEEESKFNVFALTGGILTAIGIAFWIAVSVFDVSFGGKTEVPSVGILMMENLGKEDEEFWASGMTADLITKVAGAGLIRVAPLDDILKLDKNLSIEEKAKKLRVKYMLTHQFLIKDDGFDLWCKLEKVEDGVALFSNKISEPIEMTTQMVGRLANDIVTSLNIKTKQDVMEAPTTNIEAYELYLKGTYRYVKRQNMEDAEIARGLLQKSIELDENMLLARIELAWIYYNDNNYKKAEEIYISTLKQAERNNDKIATLIALRKLGIVYNSYGEHDKALDYYNRSYDIAEEINDKQGMGWSLNNMSTIYNIKGYHTKQREYLEKALAINKEIDNQVGIGYNLSNMGHMFRSTGYLDKSLEYSQNALKIFLDIGDKKMAATELHYLGDYYIGNSDFDKALDSKNQALKLAEELGDNRQILNILTSIGYIYSNNGTLDKALEYFKRSLQIAENLEAGHGMIGNLINIGLVYNYKGDYDKALQYQIRTLKIIESMEDHEGFAHIYTFLGTTYFNMGEIDKAEENLFKSYSIQTELDYKGLVFETTIYLYLTYKNLNKKYDIKELNHLINESEETYSKENAINHFSLYYRLYQLLEDKSHLKIAYNEVKETADNLEPDVAAKFLSYPIPAAIVEEWEKVK